MCCSALKTQGVKCFTVNPAEVNTSMTRFWLDPPPYDRKRHPWRLMESIILGRTLFLTLQLTYERLASRTDSFVSTLTGGPQPLNYVMI